MNHKSESFNYSVNKDSIALIILDLPNEKINKLSSHVMKELQSLIHDLQKNETLKGAIFFSGKKNIFIAGADIKEIAQAHTSIEQGRLFLRDGHNIFNELSNLPFPTCAAIDGVCLGGGLEFVLACDFRVATDNPRTILAAPEVRLGVIPGWGGTQRLTRLIGPAHSIDLICTSRNVLTHEAYEIGLVDDYCTPDTLSQAAINLIKEEISCPSWQKRREEQRGPFQISDTEKLSIFELAKANIYKETKGHYPAPIAALEAIEKGNALPLKEGLEIELELIDPILGSEISKNLINLFFMSEELKKETWTKNKDIVPLQINEVGVLGAGIMGSGIATANISKGIPVLMKDLSKDQLKKGIDQSVKVLNSKVLNKKITQDEMNHKLALLTGTSIHSGFRAVDLVIEAVVEDIEIKKNLFTDIQKHLSESAILATNTSTISINELSESIKQRDQFIGLHFFNPVDKMPLVEVIRSKWTSDETVVTIVNYVKTLGKTPIVVNDGVGFVTTRVLFIYLNEATLLVEEGIDLLAIDKAMTHFGMPMGPLTLLDVIGIDTIYKASQILQKAFPDRYIHSNSLKVLYENKRFGQKSGLGFFKYDKKNKKGKIDETVYELIKPYINKGKTYSEDELVNRMLLPMMIEATRVLEEGVASCVRDIDIAMNLGIGFPSFRGGLLRYADSLGIKEIVNQCDHFNSLGKRYEASQMLLDMATQEKSFYSKE